MRRLRASLCLANTGRFDPVLGAFSACRGFLGLGIYKAKTCCGSESSRSFRLSIGASACLWLISCGGTARNCTARLTACFAGLPLLSYRIHSFIHTTVVGMRGSSGAAWCDFTRGKPRHWSLRAAMATSGACEAGSSSIFSYQKGSNCCVPTIHCR